MISSTQTNQPFSGDDLAAAASANTYVAAAVTRLRGAGLRITQSRVKLLTVLGQSSVPLAIEELHAAVGVDACDVVTIYRCMVAFEDVGVVRRSYRHRGTTLYERALGVQPRYRVVCKVTNQAEELDAISVGRLKIVIEEIEALLRSRGYSSVSHLLEFFGVREDIAARDGARS